MLAGGPLQTGQSPVCHRFAKQNGVSAPSGADQGPAPPPHRFNPRTKNEPSGSFYQYGFSNEILPSFALRYSSRSITEALS